MGFPYPKFKEVTSDILGGEDALPIGCVLKNGKVARAFNAVNTRRTPVTNMVCLKISPYTSGAIAYTSDGTVYSAPYLDVTILSRITTLTASKPFFIEQKTGSYTDLVLMADGKYVRARNGSYHVGSSDVSLRCGVIRCGRLFGIDTTNGHLFKWSGESGYTDWTQGISGAGQAYLEGNGGQVLEIFDFEDGLVLLRENGITRISAGGNPENFRVDGDTLLIPKYSQKTAVIVGDGLYFCANGGFYRYKGKNIVKIKGLISDDAMNADTALSYAGRYYVVGASSSKLLRRVVYIYDTVDETYQVVDFPAYYLTEDYQSVLAYSSTAICRLQPTGSFTFMCGTYDFGSHSRKLLKSLEADCDDGTTVSISNGRYTKVIVAGGVTRINMRGTKFEISVSGTGAVRSMKMKAEVRD